MIRTRAPVSTHPTRTPQGISLASLLRAATTIITAKATMTASQALL
jgi:hypothetical protein